MAKSDKKKDYILEKRGPFVVNLSVVGNSLGLRIPNMLVKGLEAKQLVEVEINVIDRNKYLEYQLQKGGAADGQKEGNTSESPGSD